VWEQVSLGSFKARNGSSTSDAANTKNTKKPETKDIFSGGQRNTFLGRETTSLMFCDFFL